MDTETQLADQLEELIEASKRLLGYIQPGSQLALSGHERRLYDAIIHAEWVLAGARKSQSIGWSKER